ncbi:hypothetical protein [Streptomyces sp. SYSU K21746]
MAENEDDRIQNDMTMKLVGFLTAGEFYGSGGEMSPQEAEASGNLALALIPDITTQGRMTPEEAGRRISQEMTAHMLRLLATFAFVFGELAEVHDAGSEMTTAELLRTLAMNAAQDNDK